MAYTYPTNLYQGWDPASAQADFNATGGAGKAGYTGSTSGGNDVDSYINAAMAPILSLIQTKQKYDEANPFFFDEKLAEEAATAEYAPYYQELLTDYTSNVEKQKSRSTADLKTTLEQLNAGKEYYTGVQRRALDKAVRSTNEGYAGKGLFFSGVRGRDVAELNTEFQKGYGEQGYYTGQYAYKANQAELTNQRTAEDLATAQTQYQRDTEREQKYAIAGGVLQRKSEVRDEYEIGRKTYYENLYA